MAKNVYLWPRGLFRTAGYSDPNLVWSTPRWDGASGQRVVNVQRASVQLAGTVSRRRAAELDIIRARLEGGINDVAVLDYMGRRRHGWDYTPALDSNGNEFWRADGRTSLYSGEAANPPTGPWRSVFAAAVGPHAVDATSIAVDGLLAGEVLPLGLMIRVGDFRHPLLAEAIADGTGAATLTLAAGLRAAVADDDPVRIPGDLFPAYVLRSVQVGEYDLHGNREFSVRLVEEYESEVTGGLNWVID